MSCVACERPNSNGNDECDNCLEARQEQAYYLDENEKTSAQADAKAAS